MKTFLTHLLLIVIILITIFPLFWLVTASFRGDNAVFSSHILPERWTLYNYKEILFPQKNIPELLNDFNNSIYAIGDFNNKSYDYRENYIKTNLTKFHSLTKETLNLLQTTEKEDLNLKNNLNEDQFKNYIFNWVNGLKIEKPNADATLTNAAIYNILKNLYVFHKKDKNILKWYSEFLSEYGVKPSMVYPRIKPYVIFRKYKTAYNNYFSEKGRFDSEQRDLKSLNEKIENEKSLLQASQDELKSVDSSLKEIDAFVQNYIKNFSTAEDVLTKNQTLNTLDQDKYNKMLSIVKNIKNMIVSQDQYPNLNKFLSISKNLSKYDPSFSDNADSLGYIFDDFIQKYNIIYRRLQEAQKLFAKQKIQNERLVSLKASIEVFENEYSRKYKEFASLEKSIISKQQILNKYYAYTLYQFAVKTENLQNLSLVLSEMIKYSDLKTPSVLVYQKKLNDFIRMKTSISNLIVNIKNFENQIKEIDFNVNEFSKKYETYFELSKAGINKFSSPYLDKASGMANVIQTSTIADFNRQVKSIDNSLKSLGRKRNMSLLTIKDSLNHLYTKKIKHEFVRWIFNTIIVATVSGIIVTIVVAITAYPFSRFRFKGRKSGLISFLIIQMFPTVMAMVAFYNIVRFLGSVFPFVGLNTLGGLVLVYLGGIAYNTWLAKGYYDTVPKSLEEAALIDGANRFQTFWIIVFPLVRPILTVIFIFTFIGAFNDFVMPKILLQNQDLYTYAIGLYQFVTGPYETEWGLFSAASLIGAIPIAVVFMLLQNFLVSGLTKGAVKG